MERQIMPIKRYQPCKDQQEYLNYFSFQEPPVNICNNSKFDFNRKKQAQYEEFGYKNEHGNILFEGYIEILDNTYKMFYIGEINTLADKRKGRGTALILDSIFIDGWGLPYMIKGKLSKVDKDKGYWKMSLPFYQSLVDSIKQTYGVIYAVHFIGTKDYGDNYEEFESENEEGHFELIFEGYEP